MGKKNVIYYYDRRGRCPVFEEIRKLPKQEQYKITWYIGLLEEQGEELRRPVADYIGDKLYELRPKEYRILYFFMIKQNVVVVHMFRKKTNHLPEKERRIALNRMIDFQDRFNRGEVIFERGHYEAY